MRSPFGAGNVAGLQYAATAFYAVAVAHGLWLHRRADEASAARAWTLAYATGTIVAFLAGSRGARSHRAAADRTRRVRVTVLLILFYGLLRAIAAVGGTFEGEDRHRRGAAAEGLALVFAYALTYGRRTVLQGDKTQ